MLKITDPIHKRIIIEDEIVERLLKTKEVQRLRRISQLGGASAAYPSATHTRFSHSLGVMHLANRFTKALNIKGEERIAAICAALLHDLGHGPFSHAFENITKTSHEIFSTEIILGDTDVNKILENYKKGFAKSVSDIISKKNKNKILTSIISSQIDADRIDYLARDSYFTGTGYGSVDTEWLITNVKNVNNKMVFKIKCMPAIENYFVGRYHMFLQIYHHKTGSRYEALVQMIFEEIRNTVDPKTTGIWESVISKNKVKIKDYIQMDDFSLVTFISSFKDSNNKKLSKLVNKYLTRNLPDSVVFETEQEAYEYNKSGIVSKQKNELYKGTLESKKTKRDPVYLLLNDGSISTLEEQSKLIKTIIKPTKKTKWVNTFYD